MSRFCLYGDVGVMLIPKVASKSIRDALGDDSRYLWAGEHPPRMIAFVRDPIERLRSCYRFFCVKYSLPEWRGFVDAVLAGEPDGHWMPQHLFIPNWADVHRFEDLPKVWEKNDFPPLPHINRGEADAVMPDYRIEELMLHYARDYELRA